MLSVYLQSANQRLERESHTLEPLIGNEIHVEGITITQINGDDCQGVVNLTLEEGYDAWLDKISFRARASAQAERVGKNPPIHFPKITYQGLTIIHSRGPLEFRVMKNEDGEGWRLVSGLMIKHTHAPLIFSDQEAEMGAAAYSGGAMPEIDTMLPENETPKTDKGPLQR